MNKIENTNSKIVTTSDLSAWVGPETLNAPPPHHIRNDKPLVEPDVFDWTARMLYAHQLLNHPDGYSLGPTGTEPFGAVALTQVLQANQLFVDLFNRYRSFSYDHLEIRVTISDPKSLVGGIHVGWYPFVDWFDKNPEEHMIATMATDAERYTQWYANMNDHCHLMAFGASHDVVFNVPWTYKTPSLFCDTYMLLDNTIPNRRSAWGDPVFWWTSLPGVVSTVDNPLPAHLKFFITVHGMKFYGPSYNIVQQSGIEVAALAEVATAVASAVGVEEAASSFLDRFIPQEDVEDLDNQGTFQNPDAVQLAYFGDMTSTEYPTTSPIFSNYVDSIPAPIPTVHEFLKRPQYICTFQSNTSKTIYGDPMQFTDDGKALNTWFRFFGMLNRYYRGTINVHFFILGHPFVEVEFTGIVTYPDTETVPTTQIATVLATHTSLFAGSKCIHMQLPFLTTRDYAEVVDAYPFDATPHPISKIEATLDVVSFITPLRPTIPVAVYVSAAPDFAFYGPRPPGLYDTAFDDVEQQVGLPFADQIETASCRAATTTNPGLFPYFPTLNDYMKLWSRAMPFAGYSSGEPVHRADVGFESASWYPPLDDMIDIDANNSWYYTCDYISLFSLIFLYYKGSMGFKIAFDLASHPNDSYGYVALGDAPGARQKTHCPLISTSTSLPDDANFGSGAVSTPMQLQPVLDFTLPYRGSNLWSYSIFNAYARPFAPLYDFDINANVNHNVILVTENELGDAMFRKISSDFFFGTEVGLPPFTIWAARGYDWSQ